MIRRRRSADPSPAASAHPGLLLHDAGDSPGGDGGAPPRFTDGPADVLLRRLELTVRRRLDGLLQGDHLGLVPGSGSEAGDSRTYHPGDDVRRMDRSTTAHVSSSRSAIVSRTCGTWVRAVTGQSIRRTSSPGW